MLSSVESETAVVFHCHEGLLMRRLELTFTGVKSRLLDPVPLAALRKKGFVSVSRGLATLTPLGTKVFRECMLVNGDSKDRQNWVLQNSRLAELGIVLAS